MLASPPEPQCALQEENQDNDTSFHQTHFNVELFPVVSKWNVHLLLSRFCPICSCSFLFPLLLLISCFDRVCFSFHVLHWSGRYLLLIFCFQLSAAWEILSRDRPRKKGTQVRTLLILLQDASPSSSTSFTGLEISSNLGYTTSGWITLCPTLRVHQASQHLPLSPSLMSLYFFCLLYPFSLLS